MTGWGVALVTTGLIVLSAVFVIIEFALMGARRHRLEEEASTRASARAALRGMNELTLMLAAAQLGITACTFALGAVTKPAVDAWLGPIFRDWGAPEWLSGGLAFALSLFAVTFLHLVVGEMAPKSWAIAHPERAAKLIGIPARAFVWPLRPFLTWVNAVANALVARVGVTPVERAAVGGRDVTTIQHLVAHSAASGTLAPDLERRVQAVIHLEQLTAGDLSRTDRRPTAVSEHATVAEAVARAHETGHLRVLLEDANGDYSRVVHVRDTLRSRGTDPILPFARQALCVPASLPISRLLARMKDTGEQFALVEGAGAFRTVVTLQDVVTGVLHADSLRS